MAFMMPVVKKEYDIYKTNRSRRVSDTAVPNSCRSRKVSECKSEAPCVSSGNSNIASPKHRSVPANMSRQYSTTSKGFESNSSSQSPIDTASPVKGDNDKSKSHFRIFDKFKKSARSKSSKDCERTSS